MKKTLLVAVLLLLVSAGNVLAKDINFTTGLSQGQFKDFSKQLGALLAYRNLAPAEPLGLTGFDVAAEASAMSIDSSSSYWEAAFGNDAPDYLGYGRLRVRKGLPLGVDIGAMYAYVPDSNVEAYGFELSKAILEGGVTMPALGIRATYTKLNGLDELDMQTVGVDASLSKGFAIITPYIGGGWLWIDSKAKGDLKALSPNLEDEKISIPRGFVGMKLTFFPLLSMTAEAEYAERPIYSLKLAVGF